MNINWEHELASLLRELSDVQHELLAVLRVKRELLVAADAEGLGRLQEREQQLCQRLQSCHERRVELLGLAQQQGLPADSIKSLAATATSHGARLGKQVTEVSGRMRLLHHHCLTNWVLAQRALLHVSQLLGILATGGRLQPTYGTGESNHSRGALVDQEA